MPKRIRSVIDRIVCYDNILLAIKDVIKGNKKRSKKQSKTILSNLLSTCESISHELSTGEFTPHGYYEFKIMEHSKERLIQSLCMYDRVVLHAIMNILDQEFVRSFILDTYASIKERGILFGLNRVRKALLDNENTRYCLKLDIKKFYNSVDQDVLIKMLNDKIDDKILMKVLINIIRSFPSGLPIGYHSSQYLGNFYLSGLDRYMKQELHIKYYFRYCDDIVILGRSKEELWEIFDKLSHYMTDELHLQIKSNYQVFPVDCRGISFLGYVIKHNKVRIRNSIKRRAFRSLHGVKSTKRIREILASIRGWILHCDT